MDRRQNALVEAHNKAAAEALQLIVRAIGSTGGGPADFLMLAETITVGLLTNFIVVEERVGAAEIFGANIKARVTRLALQKDVADAAADAVRSKGRLN